MNAVTQLVDTLVGVSVMMNATDAYNDKLEEKADETYHN